jgi:hypothetical protein
MAWNEAERRCDSVPSGIVIEVLTAAVGQVAKPQEKVAFVRIRTVHTNWHFPVEAGSSTAQFAVTAAVRFVSQRQAVGDVVRTLPPLSKFPKDLFYPFTA